jgi:hypothetical protein
MIKNALHNLSESENNNQSMTEGQRQYYKGLVIGIVSALMESGKTFGRSLAIVRANLPDDSISLDDLVPDWNIEADKLEAA